MFIEIPARLPTWKHIVMSPDKRTPSFEETVKVDRLSCIWQCIKMLGISEQTAKVMLSSWRQSTCKQYDLAWKKWVYWCDKFKVNPLKPSEAQVLNYLTNLIENKKSYSVINTHRSMLTQT